MIPSLPRPAWLRTATVVYGLLFFAFLFLPLAVVCLRFRCGFYEIAFWREPSTAIRPSDLSMQPVHDTISCVRCSTQWS